MQPSAPILFFDSGVGGLSVLEPTLKLLPNAPVVYCADSAGFPYGKKSDAELASRIPALLGRLVERYHPRLAVIACNTASTIALEHVRSALDLPVVGTVPAIKPAAEISKSRVIGVLGTEATVRQPYVDDLAAKFAADCTIIRHGSPELVELAKAKLGGDRISVQAVRAAAAREVVVDVDAVAGGHGIHALPHLDDLARHVVAGHDRERRAVGMADVLAHPDVEPVHGDRRDPHDRLAVPRRGLRELLQPQHLRPAVLAHHDRAHQ